MAHVIKTVSILSIACSTVFALGCADLQTDDDNGQSAVEQDSHGHTEIHPEDRCDPATFNTPTRTLCAAHGGDDGPNITLDQFNAELDSTHTVQSWEYGGGQIRVNSGASFQVDNKGGETHSFSIVANFGGGRVAGLNTRSNNPVAAPECLAAQGPTNLDIAAGAGITVTTGSKGTIKTKGTFKVQCCIHPWMRTTVQIN